jgi:hypothetical protein
MEGVMEQAVLQIAQQMEDKIDADLHRLDNLGEDELEGVRQSRVAVCSQHVKTSQLPFFSAGPIASITDATLRARPGSSDSP